MFQKLYKTISLIFLVAIVNQAWSQDSQTMYFMPTVPQSNFINPAIQHECKLNFGGAIIPVTGQLLPPLYLNYGNNAFAYKDVIFKGTDIYSDSLIHPFHPNADAADFFDKKLKSTNFLSFETNITLLTAGYKVESWYFSFNLAEKINTRFSYPGDLFRLIKEGNGESFLGNEVDLSNFGINATHYREWSFGASKKINTKLTVGGHLKLLFGKANVNVKKSDLTFKTAETDFAYTIAGDMQVNMSQPFTAFKNVYYDNVNDSLVFDTESLDFDGAKYMLNNKNFGLGLDFGATYELNDEITLHGSIIDFGFIKWKDNVTNLAAEGKFTYDGLWDYVDYMNPALDTDSITDAQISNFTDSLARSFKIQHTSDSYTTFLTTKLYIGGTYKVNDKLNFGVLSRSELYGKKLRSALTVSVNTRLTKWFAASTSYSIMNNSFANVGLGLVLKGGPFQFYWITDNVLAPFLPETVRNANFRMGINWIFGCKKKAAKTLID